MILRLSETTILAEQERIIRKKRRYRNYPQASCCVTVTMMDHPPAPPPPPPVPLQDPAHRRVHPIVTSASEPEESSDGGGGGGADLDTDSSSDDDAWSASDPHRSRVRFPDEFLDESLDRLDEAHVSQHLHHYHHRSVELVEGGAPPPPVAPSDATLSCPRCFAIVCTDCQRHEKYSDQYRAMFVRNIAVDWDDVWVYDDHRKALVRTTATPPTAAPSSDAAVAADSNVDVSERYCTVTCANCDTQVAVLNPIDEVYHFTGCLASA